jgi:hypothetical protein
MGAKLKAGGTLTLDDFLILIGVSCCGVSKLNLGCAQLISHVSTR